MSKCEHGVAWSEACHAGDCFREENEMSKLGAHHVLGLAQMLMADLPPNQRKLVLEEDIIVPGRARVMEGGGLSMGPPASDPLPPPDPLTADQVKFMAEAVEKKRKIPGQCLGCDTTISENKNFCHSCAVKAGVA